MQGKDKVWTVTLAPTFRMNSRGVSDKMVAKGVTAAKIDSTLTAIEHRNKKPG